MLRSLVDSTLRQLPFRQKLALLTGSSIVIALVTMALMTTALVLWTADLSSRYQQQVLRPMLSAALIKPMIEHDYASVEETVHSLIGQANLLALTVQTADGRTIVALQAESRPAHDLLVHQDTLTLRAGNAEFGRVTMRFVPTPLVALLKGLAWAVLASLLLSMAFAFWLVRRWAARVSSGLEHLRCVATTLAAGDLGVRADLSRHDEFGQLAQAFNRMAEELQQQFIALGEAEHAQRRLAAAERAQHGRLEALFGALTEGIVYTDTAHHVLLANPAFVRLWQLPASSGLVGTDLATLFSSSQLQTRLTPSDLPLETLHRGITRELLRSDGREITETCLPVHADGVLIGHVWIYVDVTDQRRMLRQVAWLAEPDSLTGLYNRRAFEHELERRLQLRGRHGGLLALMYLDLDEFKELNEGLGHATGDTLLSRLASGLSGAIRQDEYLARLGGDEFGLISWVDDEAAALGMAERMIATVRAINFGSPGSPTLHLTASAGVALAPLHGSNAGELSTAADAAMYRAKAHGRNTARLHQPDLSEAGRERLDWNQRLFRALEQQLFELYFQGIWRPDGQLSHAEVLLRLRDEADPQRLILPSQFIAHAERSGIIRQIDRWVFEAAVRTLAAEPLKLAVNVSGRTIEAGGFVEFARQVFEKHQVDPTRVVVEITETAAVGDLVDARAFIAGMRQLGCKVALDDFGSGHASFAYLKHLRTDLVKIDGQFMHHIDQEEENQIFVRAIADAARLVSGGTVAEFVEDAATAALLPGLGVTLMQGYRFDRPAPLVQFRETAAKAGGCV